LGARARFHRFDLDEIDVPGTFQSTWRPGGEIEWSHPKLFLRASYDHLEEEQSAADGLLLSDNTELSLRSRNERGPVLRAEFSLLDREDGRSLSMRVSRDRTVRLSTEWARPNLSSRYSYTDRKTTNVISDLSSLQRDHRLQLDGSWQEPRIWDSRLQLQTTLYANTRRDEVISGNLFFEEIPVVAGLYARDLTPTTDPLPESTALVDQDRLNPVLPPIDIGASSSDQNIGGDLGFSRSVAAFDIYTDRISSDLLSWDLYTSEDNIDWTRAGLVTSNYDRTQLRYELRFDAVEARYVKVVNRGGNEFADVLVTELVVFEARDDIDALTRTTSGGVMNARWSQHPSRSTSTALETSYVTNPGSSRLGRNTSLTWTARGSYRASDEMTHTLRWSQSFQRFSQDRPSVREDLAAYSYSWSPSRRFSLRTNGDARFTRVGGRQSLKIYAASTQLQVDLLPNWSVGLTPTFSRRVGVPLDDISDQWSVGANTSMSPYSSFTVTAAYRHQQTLRKSVDEANRDSADLSADWRLTPSIQLRSRWVWIQDRSRTSRQDHQASWALSRRLRLAATSTIEDSSDDQHFFRYSLSTTVDFSRRSSAYLRVSTNDLSRANGLRTDTFEQGFRTTF